MPRDSAPNKAGGPTVKMPLNVYTMMLVISFIAITAACVLLWLELKQWGPGPIWWKATTSTSFQITTTLDWQTASLLPAEIDSYRIG